MGISNFDMIQANAYLGAPGLNVPTTTGNTWYVSSVTGSNGNDGKSPLSPKATLVGAQSAATANNGDLVLVMPGHVETVTATSWTLSKAGVTYIGLGYGAARPTLTWNAAASTCVVSAASHRLSNFVFIANFADVTTAFTVTTGNDLQIVDCSFRDTTSSLNFLAYVTTTVSVVADGLRFERNICSMLGTTAATTPIKIAGTHDRVHINDNIIVKAVLNNTSCLLSHGSLVVTNLEMARNKVFSKNTDSATGGFLITTSATTNTGMVYDNYVNGLDVAAEILVTAGSKYGMMNNLYDGDADASGFVSPAIGSTA